MHRRVREQRRLRMAAVILASLLVLGALPLFFGIRAATRDPVFNSLDALQVPSWAAGKTVDDVSGSRWCIIECRYRERTVESTGTPDDTAKVYEKALADEGWQRWKPDLCPEQKVAGHYTCWRRDELTLDLWVRPPACPPAEPTEGAVAPPSPATDAAECKGSLISVKVRNAIDDDRTRPQPSTDPSLTGEDPDPTLPPDPLGDLTASPS
ncbi:hypothetical protein AB0J86_16930 [Micromonospora sp. NPDC049559]|uniref:hypothetical protein n=1 Tax=Micromonospora sp. NPDC049559 TaxID=3155923 RepID=UPI00343D3288